MNIDPSIGATNPFHIARAYGLRQATPVQPVKPVNPAGSLREAAAHLRAGDAAPSAELPAARADKLRSLVAAVVPGRIDFDAPGGPVQRGASLPFYTHPADRNAAATALQAGRAIDTTG